MLKLLTKCIITHIKNIVVERTHEVMSPRGVLRTHNAHKMFYVTEAFSPKFLYLS